MDYVYVAMQDMLVVAMETCVSHRLGMTIFRFLRW